MKLTGRQKAFLKDFLDLYRELDGPIHYATVAERLGIGRVTAYDMLRLLEEKGLVTSEYVLPSGRSGAGRSTLVFRPTQKAHDILTELAGGDMEQASWEETKEAILEALRQGKANDYHNVLEDILLRLEEESSPLVEAAEWITALALGLRELQSDLTANGLPEPLKNKEFPEALGLEALAGLTVGLSFVERVNRYVILRLSRHLYTYQKNLAKLNEQNRKKLTEFAQEVWRITHA
jgi:predicted transcriptional regulator